jgi:hypothetical protein
VGGGEDVEEADDFRSQGQGQGCESEGSAEEDCTAEFAGRGGVCECVDGGVGICAGLEGDGWGEYVSEGLIDGAMTGLETCI